MPLSRSQIKRLVGMLNPNHVPSYPVFLKLSEALLQMEKASAVTEAVQVLFPVPQ